MPRTCTICRHPEVEGIDADLINGKSIRDIASRRLVSRQSVHRHKAEHVSRKLVLAHKAEEASNADDLLETVRDLLEEARDALRGAKATGHYGHAASNIRESLRAVELLARLRGDLESGTRITTNILVQPQWVSLRAAVFGALQSHPEARRAVGQALASLEASDAVSDDGAKHGP